VIRVGLSTYVEDARWGVWDQTAALLPANYVETVVDAGGVPILLPPIVPDGAAASVVGSIDALVLTGGPDVSPERYGAGAHERTDRPRTERDAWELALLRAALDADLPVLAVCRGAQLLNVACGGTLHQHLPDVAGADPSAHRPELGTFGTVPVKVSPGSRLAAIVGDEVKASCHHHQAIDRLGDGLIVTARAADETIEAVELDDGDRFVVGVQWHPEQDHDTRLFTAVIDAARSPGT
jgi:gamma-glutamyl-gamma-aminobutyrate hydrolase PuuD